MLSEYLQNDPGDVACNIVSVPSETTYRSTEGSSPSLSLPAISYPSIERYLHDLLQMMPYQKRFKRGDLTRRRNRLDRAKAQKKHIKGENSSLSTLVLSVENAQNGASPCVHTSNGLNEDLTIEHVGYRMPVADWQWREIILPNSLRLTTILMLSAEPLNVGPFGPRVAARIETISGTAFGHN